MLWLQGLGWHVNEASGAEAEEDGDPLAAAEGGETAETEEAAVLMEDKKHISTEN